MTFQQQETKEPEPESDEIWSDASAKGFRFTPFNYLAQTEPEIAAKLNPLQKDGKVQATIEGFIYGVHEDSENGGAKVYKRWIGKDVQKQREEAKAKGGSGGGGQKFIPKRLAKVKVIKLVDLQAFLDEHSKEQWELFPGFTLPNMGPEENPETNPFILMTKHEKLQW